MESYRIKYCISQFPLFIKASDYCLIFVSGWCMDNSHLFLHFQFQSRRLCEDPICLVIDYSHMARQAPSNYAYTPVVVSAIPEI